MFDMTDQSTVDPILLRALTKKRQLQKQIAEIDEFIYLGGTLSVPPAPVPVERRDIADVVDQILLVYGPKSSDDLLRFLKARGKVVHGYTDSQQITRIDIALARDSRFRKEGLEWRVTVPV
jgi:hypothetical protein